MRGQSFVLSILYLPLKLSKSEVQTDVQRHSSLNLVLRQLKLYNNFIFGMAYWLRFLAERSVSHKEKNNYHGNRLITLCNNLELYIVDGPVGKDSWIDLATWSDVQPVL